MMERALAEPSLLGHFVNGLPWGGPRLWRCGGWIAAPGRMAGAEPRETRSSLKPQGSGSGCAHSAAP